MDNQMFVAWAVREEQFWGFMGIFENEALATKYRQDYYARHGSEQFQIMVGVAPLNKGRSAIGDDAFDWPEE